MHVLDIVFTFVILHQKNIATLSSREIPTITHSLFYARQRPQALFNSSTVELALIGGAPQLSLQMLIP